MSVDSNLVLVAILIALIVLVCTLRHETFVLASPNSSYAYQDNKQPFYLTSKSVKLWMDPARRLCAQRVQAECSTASKLDKPGCVQRSLYQCNLANQRQISQKCVNKLPYTMCKRACNRSKSLCEQCVANVQLYGVCQTPDLAYP